MYKPFLNPEKYLPATPVEGWRKVLLDAAELIRTKGHAKRALRDDNGAHCAIGAIKAAASGDALAELNGLALEAASAFSDTVPGYSIATWNNAPERTAQEVIDALEAAAKS